MAILITGSKRPITGRLRAIPDPPIQTGCSSPPAAGDAQCDWWRCAAIVAAIVVLTVGLPYVTLGSAARHGSREGSALTSWWTGAMTIGRRSASCFPEIPAPGFWPRA